MFTRVNEQVNRQPPDKHYPPNDLRRVLESHIGGSSDLGPLWVGRRRTVVFATGQKRTLIRSWVH